MNEIGRTLSGNATQDGALGALGNLLNPWRGSDAAYALVTINNFPKAIDLDLNVTDTYSGDHRFRYSFPPLPEPLIVKKIFLSEDSTVCLTCGRFM